MLTGENKGRLLVQGGLAESDEPGFVRYGLTEEVGGWQIWPPVERFQNHEKPPVWVINPSTKVYQT